MEVTLSQLIHMAPELGSSLKDDIRAGRLSAQRKRGVAGRPYTVRTEDLEASERAEYRELADMALRTPTASPTRPKRTMMGAPALPGSMRTDTELFDIVESQHMMLKDLVQVLSQEMRGRFDRMDRQQMQMQELSYKLGQAHQEIARLERLLAQQSFGRMDEAK
jgi:hypothetical protein